MPYTETHTIEIGPITLPAGVTADVTVATGTGGQQSVKITGSTASSRADTAALLQSAFALLMTAATAEGVGQPVFGRDVSAPSAPAALSVTTLAPTQVGLSWTASTDNIGVDHYVVARDGVQLAVVPGTSTSYTDTAVLTAQKHTYSVAAVDAAGNVSPSSNQTTVTIP